MQKALMLHSSLTEDGVGVYYCLWRRGHWAGVHGLWHLADSAQRGAAGVASSNVPAQLEVACWCGGVLALVGALHVAAVACSQGGQW